MEVLDYPDDAQQFGARVRQLTDGKGVPAVYDGVGKSTFEASLASLAVRGTLALFGADRYPVLMGRLGVPLLMAMAVAPYIGGVAFETGGADLTLIVLTTIASVNVVLVVLLRAMTWRNRERA